MHLIDKLIFISIRYFCEKQMKWFLNIYFLYLFIYIKYSLQKPRMKINLQLSRFIISLFLSKRNPSIKTDPKIFVK